MGSPKDGKHGKKAVFMSMEELHQVVKDSNRKRKHGSFLKEIAKRNKIADKSV